MKIYLFESLMQRKSVSYDELGYYIFKKMVFLPPSNLGGRNGETNTLFSSVNNSTSPAEANFCF